MLNHMTVSKTFNHNYLWQWTCCDYREPIITNATNIKDSRQSSYVVIKKITFLDNEWVNWEKKI